ncbi:hypothetical protein ACO1NJ_14710, partial [Staphylococcus aureus]
MNGTAHSSRQNPVQQPAEMTLNIYEDTGLLPLQASTDPAHDAHVHLARLGDVTVAMPENVAPGFVMPGAEHSDGYEN